MTRYNPLMLVGTGSDVGKSILCTALCRIFLQDGCRPAPFKAQNMALNSFVTPDGCEIGRAQAVQAEACGLPPHSDMNPVLLKPNSEHTTQVVLNGHPVGSRSAYEYFRGEGRDVLWQEVCAAFDRLQAKGYNPIVMEGAGSVSELNLRDRDIVNMPMARYANANVILVADIDRGGVFASCYGSVMLQTPEDRQRIKGIIINKFRGDRRLFDDGCRLLEQTCGIPVLGVVPYLEGLAIDAEDSVALGKKQRKPTEGKVNVAVVLLRHISNFTDFDALERDRRVNLYYTDRAEDLEEADVIVLPGTKSTLDDLYHLRLSGLAKAIVDAHERGATVVGICGGFQMLGRKVCDAEGIEGSIAELPGLGLLDILTVLSPQKITRQVEFEWKGAVCRGYEIHQGRSFHVLEPDTSSSMTDSESSSKMKPLQTMVTERDRVVGTYVHGFFDNASVCDWLLERWTKENLQPSSESSSPNVNTSDDFKEQQYNLLAEQVRRYVDIPKLYKIMAHD